MTAPRSSNHVAPANTAAAALLERRVEQTERAVERIDHDPEEALAAVTPLTTVTPGAAEISTGDMFRLMSQMQQQMGAMQEQIIRLMTGQSDGGRPQQSGRDNAEELARDRLQRELTLKSWDSEPRRPVFIHPDQDEEKIQAVTNQYPPRVFRINGLEFPIMVGQIQNVPESIASLVEHTQRKRPMQGGPQALPLIADPQQGQFLAGGQNISVGHAGKSGQGPIVPEGQPPIAPLGERYDAYGR